jgi:hypothetical protein
MNTSGLKAPLATNSATNLKQHVYEDSHYRRQKEPFSACNPAVSARAEIKISFFCEILPATGRARGKFFRYTLFWIALKAEILPVINKQGGF